LVVAVPLVGSVLPVLSESTFERPGWSLATVTLAVYTTLVALVCRAVVRDGSVSTAVGSVPEPFGIVLVVDALSAPFLALTAVVGLGVVTASRQRPDRSGSFYSLSLLLVGGITGLCVTADLFNLYVFLEISGLASYALVAQGDHDETRLNSDHDETGLPELTALKYLLLGTVGASFYLLGVGYTYVATGTLGMAALAPRLAANGGLGGVLPVTAVALMLVGLGVKVAVFPLHVWKPDAYAAAPPAVAALLSALVSTAAAYAVVRLLLSAYTAAFLAAVPLLETALLVVGIVSVLAGSLLAFRESDVRRLLAYSSVAQFGLVTVGIAVATPAALVGVVVHLVGHAVTKGGFYLAAGVAAREFDAETVDDYAGLGARTPVLSVAVAVFALGLIGIPPTVGFAGKLYVLLGTVEGASPVAAAIVLASTLASLAYFAPLLQRMFVESSPVSRATRAARTARTARATHSPPRGLLAVVLLAALLTLVLGFGAGRLAQFVEPTIREALS
jgi:multicomponent Na+:H+ antiporter subunit D